MNTKKDEGGNKGKWTVPVIILVVVVCLIAVAYLLMNSNFNVVDFVIKLHGG